MVPGGRGRDGRLNPPSNPGDERTYSNEIGLGVERKKTL